MENELEFLEKRIVSDQKKVEELHFKAENDKLAAKLHDIYQSYRDAGFSEDQSFWMLAQLVKKALKNC